MNQTAQIIDEKGFFAMTESSLDPETIKKTQESLGKFVKKPPLTEKLLKKPPFKFIHDVIKVVSESDRASFRHHRCFIDLTKFFVISFSRFPENQYRLDGVTLCLFLSLTGDP